MAPSDGESRFHTKNITGNTYRESILYNTVADMDPKSSTGHGSAPWTYFTNHAHVLILLARDASSTMREVADAVGITERAVQRIVGELEEAHVLKRSRKGRRNVYAVNPALALRHPLESHCTVADLLALVNAPLGKPPKNRH